jgi:serine/threonine protein kinase
MTSDAVIADRYEIIRQLGQGSFARTLLARDRELDRQVAIKVLRPRDAPDLKAFELFEREAQVLRDLRHPAIPAIHAFLRAPWNGSEAAFLVMEYIEGTSFAELIEHRRHLEPELVLHLLLELLGVLDYLHSRMPPVLHRDIKPANIIVRPGDAPALVDFGAVRNVFRGPDEPGSTIVGTYGYMPYEQYMGQASPASDLFALGATFLHLITGRAPPQFLGASGRLEIPADLHCDEPLRSVLSRMLAPAPAERFQSAREVRTALVARPAAGVPATVTPSPPPVQRQHPLAAASPAPRALDRSLRNLLKRSAYSPWQLMNSSTKVDGISAMPFLLVVLLSVGTVGILPAVFWSIYLSRKRRLKAFFKYGLPGTARVVNLAPENTGFGEKLMRVRYEFEADGHLHRGVDHVLPALAEWWVPGEVINILYRPDREYDSVIVSPS